MISIVYRGRPCKQRFLLLQVIRCSLCCLFAFGGTGSAVADPIYHLSGQVSSDRADQTDDNAEQDYGVPILRIDESRWFDIIIDLPDHPETAQEVEEQRNRNAQSRKLGKPETPIFFPDVNDITEGLRLRFHYRFN